jgi:hypothetical protein
MVPSPTQENKMNIDSDLMLSVTAGVLLAFFVKYVLCIAASKLFRYGAGRSADKEQLSGGASGHRKR